MKKPLPAKGPLPARYHGHEVYTAKDFNAEERQRRNVLYVMVVEGGLEVCRRCSAAEIELDEYPSCKLYWAAQRKSRSI